MYMSSMITINWGNLPNEEYALARRHLISGPTGAGKSTLLDGVQTVMTATRPGLYEYNAGKDDISAVKRGEKIERSLETYVLGCDGTRFARTTAQAAVAIIFEPEYGEQAGPMTAVVAASAELSSAGKMRTARLTGMALFVCDNIRLSKADFIDDDVKGSRSLVPLDMLYGRLRSAYEFGIHEFGGDKKGHYLQKLYGALQGRRQVSDVEARFAAGAFSRFMAYKKIDNVDQFVFEYILDPPTRIVDVVRLNDLMREGNRIRKESARLAECARRLDRLLVKGDEYRVATCDMLTARLAVALFREQIHTNSLAASQKEIVTLTEHHRRRTQQAANLNDQVGVLEREISSIKDQLGKREASQARLSLERERDGLLAQHRLLRLTLNPNFERFSKSSLALEQLLKLDTAIVVGDSCSRALQKWDKIAAQLVSAAVRHRLVFVEGRVKESSVSACAKAFVGLREAAARIGDVHVAVGMVSVRARDTRARLNAEKDALQSHQVSLRGVLDALQRRGELLYPESVRSALDLIRREMPLADARPLCELIEVREGEWHAAIEGFIGHNRFAILIKNGRESEALELLAKANAPANIRIVQAAQTQEDATSITMKPNSIVNELRTSDAVARAFLKVNYGGVIKTEMGSELTAARRVLTSAGLAADGYTIFFCLAPAYELVFGQHAREQRQIALETDLSELDLRIASNNNTLAKAIQICDLVDGFALPSLDEQIAHLHTLTVQCAHIDDLLEAMHDPEGERLADLLFKISKEAQTCKNAMNAAQVDINSYTAGIQLAQKQKAALQLDGAGLVAACERASEELEKLATFDDRFDMPSAICSAKAESKSGQVLVRDLEERATRLEGRIAKIQFGVVRAVGEYNVGNDGRATISEQLPFNEDLLSGDGFWSWPGDLEIRKVLSLARSVHRRIKDTALPDAELRIMQASRDFNTTFTRDLCQIITNEVADGKQRLRDLTHALSDKCFGEIGTFTFRGTMKAEFTEYTHLFEEILAKTAGPEQPDFFTDGVLSEAATATRKKLFADLWSEDLQVAAAKLKEIGDYRHYMTYDIERIVDGEAISLSKVGSASSGQNETPMYIIRAAAYSSALRLGEEGPRLRTVFLDEAFGRVDEPITRDVLDYLNDELNLQVVFAMPTKSCGAFLDTVDAHYQCVKVRAERMIGELTKRVIVNRGKYNNEAIRKIWEMHRVSARERVSAFHENGGSEGNPS